MASHADRTHQKVKFWLPRLWGASLAGAFLLGASALSGALYSDALRNPNAEAIYPFYD